MFTEFLKKFRNTIIQPNNKAIVFSILKYKIFQISSHVFGKVYTSGIA